MPQNTDFARWWATQGARADGTGAAAPTLQSPTSSRAGAGTPGAATHGNAGTFSSLSAMFSGRSSQAAGPAAGSLESQDAAPAGGAGSWWSTFSGPGAPDAWDCGMSRLQKLQMFFLLGGTGVVFMLLALFVFLPIVLLSPGKFAMAFTLGSTCIMAALAVLRGPYSTTCHLLARDKLPFSGLYIGSIIGTVWAAIWVQSYLLVMAMAIVQCITLAWYVGSYLPGGTAGMCMAGRLCWRATSSGGRGITAWVLS